MTEEKNTVPTITRKDVTPLETPLMMTAMRYGFAAALDSQETANLGQFFGGEKRAKAGPQVEFLGECAEMSPLGQNTLH